MPILSVDALKSIQLDVRSRMNGEKAMVSFKLTSYIDGFYRYEVYPEGKEDYKGFVEFNPETKVLKEWINPPEPFDRDKWISMALNGLRDKDGNYRETGYVAWY
ncbi:hypothetical protein [Granulicatella seriolae]|uniref:Uncharacterized protein n=1 Tax=Granulicatella seriolae TaxID=2967226 RepID=A0ABT1WLI9_9LACT|nr:hypothetical protein [Granulicatella seriolae]